MNGVKTIVPRPIGWIRGSHPNLVLRELRTRYGRRDGGFIWMFVEPLAFGLAMAGVRSFRSSSSEVETFVFITTGFTLFILFRQMVNRATGVIQGSRGLLYHRQVSLPSMFLAVNLIQTIIGIVILAIFTIIGAALGANWPEDPAQKLLAALLMALLGQGFGLIAACITHRWPGTERVITLSTMLLMPFSGVFAMAQSLPLALRETLLWLPMLHIIEFMREGQYGPLYVYYYDLSYVLAWIAGLHLIGLAGLRLVRARITME